MYFNSYNLLKTENKILEMSKQRKKAKIIKFILKNIFQLLLS